MTEKNPLVEIRSYTKTIKGSVVLDNVSCGFRRGRVACLFGRNGSGKTMLMRAVAGLIKPSSGSVLVDGVPLNPQLSFPPSIGLMLENPEFLPQYTGHRNLKLIASIKNVIGDGEIDTALQRVGLDPRDARPFKKYSLGMKQRLGIACAVMEHPDIILLDEPCNALDETGRKLIWGIVRQERNRGACVIIACHERTDAEAVSDEIIEMQDGKITARVKLGEVRS